MLEIIKDKDIRKFLLKKGLLKQEEQRLINKGIYESTSTIGTSLSRSTYLSFCEEMAKQRFKRVGNRHPRLFTEKFEKFLTDNRLRAKVIREMKKQPLRFSRPSLDLDEALCWSNTTQGHEYWKVKQRLCQKYFDGKG